MATKEFEFHIDTDQTDFAIRHCSEKVNRALEKIGLKAEGYAQGLCPVDTGLLRNSITHAVSGNPTAISSYSADKPKNGEIKTGSYSGTEGTPDQHTVYVGTNVEYAIYVEMGSNGRSGRPYIKPSIQNHISEYQSIFDTELKS